MARVPSSKPPAQIGQTFQPSCRYMFVHQVLDGICAEPPAREAGEKELACEWPGFLHPSLQHRSDKHFSRAAATCLFTKSWTASALSLPPERLGKRNLLANGQGSFIQASSTRRVVFERGVQRCFRPLPTHWMCAPGPSVTSSRQSPVSSDKRKPVCMATTSTAESR